MSSVINAILVDDESPARDELRFLLDENCPSVNIVTEFNNSPDAFEYIKDNMCDLIFLDIEMPEMSGIELAKKILEEIEFPPFIIFVTAYNEFAHSAFEVSAVDYILKPINSNRLIQAIDKIEQRVQLDNSMVIDKSDQLHSLIEKLSEQRKPSSRIALSKGERLIPVEMNEIIYATVIDKATYAFTTKGKFAFNGGLKEFEEILPAAEFFRCHKSFIINISLIQSIDIWFNGCFQLKMDGIEEMIPVSRSNSKDLKQLLNIR